MRRLIMKAKDSICPKETWEDSQLVVYYLGDEVEDVRIEETQEFNFEELFIRLKAGKSVFMTLNPRVAHTRAREKKMSLRMEKRMYSAKPRARNYRHHRAREINRKRRRCKSGG